MLRLMLLGDLQISLDDAPVTGFISSKVPALLAYLAVTGRPHARPVLASLLWGDVSEKKAASSLRMALYSLRQVLPAYLQTTRQTIAFDRERPYWLDVEVFSRQAEQALQQRLRRPLSPRQIGSLQEAAELYRGEFLEGLQVRDAPAFEEWLLLQRENLRLLALQALHVLIGYYSSRGEYADAIRYGTRLLTIEPWQEEIHRQVMRLLALSGQRAAALVQYENCRRLLADELDVEPDEETVSLYEQIKAGDVLAETAPGSSRRHNLPPQLTPFVGRRLELALLLDRLLDPDYRLLTLFGEGGVGKTRLALAVAGHLLDRFAQGVWYVPLAEVAAGDVATGRQRGMALHNLMAAAIASALSLGSGAGRAKDSLFDHLRGRELLLLLDNLEYLIDGSDFILDLLRNAPQVSVLAISRQRLNLQAEYAVRLWGLKVPVDVRDPRALSYSSVQLFAERAERACPGFALDAAGLSQVVRICQLVEGHPLAIELAAAWVGRFSLPEIAQAIAEDAGFLSTTMRDFPERHRSVRAVFESSWRLLAEQEQLTLAQVSLFRGGFDRQAASAVISGSAADLAVLVDKSLLRQSASGRYELHELLRQFAGRKLAQTGLGDVFGERHSLYYLDFVAQREPALCGPEPQQASAEMTREGENIRQAWRWAADQRHIEAVQRSIRSLTRYLRQASRFQEGETLVGMAVQRFRDCAEMPDKPQRPLQVLRGRLFVEHAHFLNDLAAYDRAMNAAQAAIEELAQVSGEAALEAGARFARGNALAGQARDQEAQTELALALELFREIGDRHGECSVLSRLAGVAWNLGDRAGAKVYLEQSLGMCRTIGDRWGESTALNWLGGIAYSSGDVLQAEEHWRQSLRRCRELGDRFGESRALGGLGVIANDLGEYARAQDHLERVLCMCREIGDRQGEGIRLYDLGNLAYDLGDNRQARSFYEQAWHVLREIGDRKWEVRALAGLGLVFRRSGELETAREYCQQALVIAREIAQPSEQAVALTCLGHVLSELGLPIEADDLYQQALSLWRARDVPNMAMEPLAGRARVAMAQQDLSLAQTYVELVLEHLQPSALQQSDAYRLAGIFDPFQVYLTAYHVLRANEDPRATAVLTTAHKMLQERAAGIGDDRVRRLFLEDIPAHRDIVAEFRRQIGS